MDVAVRFFSLMKYSSNGEEHPCRRYYIPIDGWRTKRIRLSGKFARGWRVGRWLWEIRSMGTDNKAKCDLTFQNIHDIYQPKLFRYLSNLIDEYEAEDLTQEVFAKVSTNLETFRGESSISTWLYRIATNLAIDRIRHCTLPFADPLKRAEKPIDAHEEIEDRNVWTGEKPHSAEERRIRGEMTDCIRSCLENLPEAYRIVLVLSELENFRNREISEIIDVTLETVMIRLHWARALLRKEIEKNCRVYGMSVTSSRVSQRKTTPAKEKRVPAVAHANQDYRLPNVDPVSRD